MSFFKRMLVIVLVVLVCTTAFAGGVQVKVGSTSVILPDIIVLDSSSSIGASLTGLAFGTSGLTCYYHRNTASASVSVSLATMTLGTWATGGFKEVDATHMQGVYSFCPPDAALAVGAQRVVFTFSGATNMVPVTIEIELVAFDPLDAAALGLSRIDATISSRSTLGGTAQTGDSFARLGAPSGASIEADIQTRLSAASYTAPPSASTNAAAVWEETMVSHLTSGTTGAALNAAGSSGDPWATSLPGAYGVGTAGYILGHSVPVSVSDITNAIMGKVVENAGATITFQQAINLILTTQTGTSSGAATLHPTFYAPDGTTIRMIGITNTKGDRLSRTLSPGS